MSIRCLMTAVFACFIIHTSTNAMNAHPAFSKLPRALQSVYGWYPNDYNWKVIVQSALFQKRVSLEVDQSIWLMAAVGHISFLTANRAMTNMYLRYQDAQYVDDKDIDWEQEEENKIKLIDALNCSKVRQSCLLNINSELSLLLQADAFLQLHPDSILKERCPWAVCHTADHIIKEAAKSLGCCNVERFGIKYPNNEYMTSVNHQFCNE